MGEGEPRFRYEVLGPPGSCSRSLYPVTFATRSQTIYSPWPAKLALERCWLAWASRRRDVTGGIGENASEIRARICDEWAGLTIEPNQNAQTLGREAQISAADSKLQAWLIPTDEELRIARDAVRCILGERIPRRQLPGGLANSATVQLTTAEMTNNYARRHDPTALSAQLACAITAHFNHSPAMLTR